MNPTNESHRDIAELILARAGATEADLLRAIAHAVLAGYRPPLAYDAFAPHSAAEASERNGANGGFPHSLLDRMEGHGGW